MKLIFFQVNREKKMNEPLPDIQTKDLPVEISSRAIRVPSAIEPSITALISRYWEATQTGSQQQFLEQLNQFLAQNLLKQPQNEEINATSSTEMEQLWCKVIEHLSPATTKALFAQQGILISYSEQIAVVGIKSENLYKLHQSKIPNLEQAFTRLVGQPIKVNLIIATNLTLKSQQAIVAPNNKDVSIALPNKVASLGQNGLSISQDQAMSALKNFLSSKERYFRLTGYAGTGKTYLICCLMEWLKTHQKKFVVAAPTNKAAKNLIKIASEKGLNENALTLARLLSQQPQIDEQTGKELFVSTVEVDLSEYDVIIIDEFSLISLENFTEICQALKEAPKCKIIFSGDAAQLPPVGEKSPIVATTPLIKHSADLLEIVRYEGEIALIAEQIRNCDQYNERLYPYKTTSDNSLIVLEHQQWLTLAGNYFDSENSRQNPDFVRILVWRNKTADGLNNYIRERLWGKEAPAFVIGERLIAKKPVFRQLSQEKKKRKKDWGIVMNNSEECEVIGIPELVTNKNDYQYWSVPVITESQSVLKLRILTPSSEEKRSFKLKQLADSKQWKEYIALNKSYDYVSYAYALTTHKAQGSSLDYIFVAVSDFYGCSDLQKIQYTALTRAKKRAYIPTKNSNSAWPNLAEISQDLIPRNSQPEKASLSINEEESLHPLSFYAQQDLALKKGNPLIAQLATLASAAYKKIYKCPPKRRKIYLYSQQEWETIKPNILALRPRN